MTGVLVATSGETDWLAARSRGVTASEIACVMGLAPASWDSPYSLYHRKLGILPQRADGLALRVGRHFEELVADLFGERFEDAVAIGDGRQLYAHPGRQWQMATPDRVLWGSGTGAPYAVLECKTDGGYDGWGDDGTDEIPVHYRCQVLWQCSVLGLDTWYVACLFTHSRTLKVYTGTLGDDAQADLAVMLREGEEFLSRLLERREPDIDWRPATRDAIAWRYQDLADTDVTIDEDLADSYADAIRAHDQAEQLKDEMTSKLMAVIGDGRRAIHPVTGDRIATRSVPSPKRIDVGRLRELYPDVAAELTRSKPEPRLLPARPWKKDPK